MAVWAPGSHCIPEKKRGEKKKNNQLQFKQNIPEKEANFTKHFNVSILLVVNIKYV
jgi:hypothetical protein